MSTLNHQYLTSFFRRANARLAALTRELAGALASGDEAARDLRAYEGLLLSHGLRSTQNADNLLTDEQRVYIAGKLLPLQRDADPVPGAPVPVAPTLTLSALSGRLRGQADTQPLTVKGYLGGTLPAGAQLILSRDGREIHREAAVTGALSFTDSQPGTRYRLELTGTGLSRERSRALTSPVLCGVLPHEASAEQLAALPLAGPFVSGVSRNSVLGTRNRIYFCVPVARAPVTGFTQPDDNDADITSAFGAGTRRTLVFGSDGSDTYEVFENYANFIGPFTFDAHQ
ncbi:hypothetical protein [Hymenobacter siberiensis]|uniref:hypothetical protein n=1 Tax=Hymenobacter siberiensis TaxID=2848396 RepID=UPI001C1E00B3|nr:hypothetical protein [Hymenobacter siberiensis]